MSETSNPSTYFEWPNGVVSASYAIRWGMCEEHFDEISAWLCNTWFPNNQTWVRTWRTDPEGKEERQDQHFYSDSFSGPPTASIDGAKIEIRFRILDMKSYWRDWIIVKFGADIENNFPVLKRVDMMVSKSKQA